MMSKNSISNKLAVSIFILGTPRRVLLGHIHPQDADSNFLQNADNYIPIAMVLYHRRIYLQQFRNNFTSIAKGICVDK
jgi:hypothetical protein